MPSPSRVRLAFLLACTLLLGTAAPAQTVSRGPARQPPPTLARQVNLLPSVERRRFGPSTTLPWELSWASRSATLTCRSRRQGEFRDSTVSTRRL